jgi:cation:H+ antiporter
LRELFLVWLKLVACFAIILFAGTRLARYGDAIAEKTGLGRLWVGLIFLGLITSMPELATGVSAVAFVKLPDLALGTIFGSCTFNLLIIAILDVQYRHGPILSQAGRNHIISAIVGLVLIAFTAASIWAGDWLAGVSLGWVGVPSILIVVLFLAGARVIYRLERKQKSKEPPAVLQYEHESTRATWLRFIVAGVLVIGAGTWLAFVGEEIAEVTGLESSFVGTLFLAVTTSLPEIALTVAAVRLGAIDLAVADVLGANMINILKIFIIDLFYNEGPVLSSVSNVHIVTAIVAVVMSSLVILGLRFPSERKTFFFINWYGPLLVGLYVLAAYVLFRGISFG